MQVCTELPLLLHVLQYDLIPFVDHITGIFVERIERRDIFYKHIDHEVPVLNAELRCGTYKLGRGWVVNHIGN